MLFTRTIRRKLLLVLGLVLGMLLTLAVGGISGLYSFRGVVRELDYEINDVPHQTELVAALGPLYEALRPLKATRPQSRRQSDMRNALKETLRRVIAFRRKLDVMPPAQLAASQKPIVDMILSRIETGLKHLDTNLRSLTPDEAGDAVADTMLDELSLMTAYAQQFPEQGESWNRTLDAAKTDYRSKLVILWSATAVVFVLFIILARCGYVWVFQPIRKLHQGARRVAQGDFDYRVQLTSRDEMAELAEAFNQMTDRFQEVAGNLDRQVQERSKQLVRSERLAGVGFLAAGVAHEINNPLSAIAMAAESLEGRIADLLGNLPEGDADVVRQYLQMIQNESFRCKQITERLLDFSRGRDAARESIDLARLVSEVVAMVQYLSKYREKRIEFARTAPCYAEVNGPEIKQVVLNLVANGLESMERGGTLRIDFAEQTDHVVIQFTDEGCGMTAEVLENMFEPFFTRKQSGQGTGLGLSISHRIISQHGGTLSASSSGPGKGSVFTVHLPRRAANHAAA